MLAGCMAGWHHNQSASHSTQLQHPQHTPATVCMSEGTAMGILIPRADRKQLESTSQVTLLA